MYVHNIQRTIRALGQFLAFTFCGDHLNPNCFLGSTRTDMVSSHGPKFTFPSGKQLLIWLHQQLNPVSYSAANPKRVWFREGDVFLLAQTEPCLHVSTYLSIDHVHSFMITLYQFSHNCIYQCIWYISACWYQWCHLTNCNVYCLFHNWLLYYHLIVQSTLKCLGENKLSYCRPMVNLNLTEKIFDFVGNEIWITDV